MSDRFGRARAMAGQGFHEEAVDELSRACLDAGLELGLELDDRGRALLEVSYDPVLVEQLKRIPGTVRDKEAGSWRIRSERVNALIALLEQLSGPLCSPEQGCALLDHPVSSPHQQAHAAHCL